GDRECPWHARGGVVVRVAVLRSRNCAAACTLQVNHSARTDAAITHGAEKDGEPRVARGADHEVGVTEGFVSERSERDRLTRLPDREVLRIAAGQVVGGCSER